MHWGDEYACTILCGAIGGILGGASITARYVFPIHCSYVPRADDEGDSGVDGRSSMSTNPQSPLLGMFQTSRQQVKSVDPILCPVDSPPPTVASAHLLLRRRAPGCPDDLINQCNRSPSPRQGQQAALRAGIACVLGAGGDQSVDRSIEAFPAAHTTPGLACVWLPYMYLGYVSHATTDLSHLSSPTSSRLSPNSPIPSRSCA